MKHFRKRLVGTVVALSISAIGYSAAPPVASAKTSTTLRYTMKIRSAPSTGSQGVAIWAKGTRIDVACQTTGTRWAEGAYANNVTWDRLTNGRYVHDMGTNLPGGNKVTYSNGTYAYFTPGIPRCANPPSASADKAVTWALNQVGKWQASGSDASAYGNWAPGPYGEWSGDCYYFAYRAQTYAGRNAYSNYGTAIATYRAYRDAGRIRSGEPAPGAIVFYNYSSAGHAAVYVGSGNVVSTIGLDGAKANVAKVAIDRFPNRLGWVMP